MFDSIMKRMREKIRTCQYVMTIHAEEEMDDDELSVFDVECCILTGKIIERQKDRVTNEWKYLVEGQSIAGGNLVVVNKFSPTGKLVVITVYLV